jgi:glycosyltransferase involved in cell wall biosynthesis
MKTAADPPVLMVAFHFPPCTGGSGIHRTLKFCRYLPKLGWAPLMVSAHPRAYERVGGDRLDEIPGQVIVDRAFALDAGRHLSVRGIYLRWTGLPDRWVSWWPGAVLAGMKMIRRHRPALLWSTYPIATAHLIGLTLHRLTGIPWVADFRDSMTEEDYPRDPLVRRVFLWIERQTVRHSSRLIFTTFSTREMYLKRYPTLSPERCLVIQNGYDEEDFRHVRLSPCAPVPHTRPVRLIHAGVIYPEERDPLPFFKALAKLKQEKVISSASLKIDLRAAGSEGYYTKALGELDLLDIVTLLPGVPYAQALQECADADGLLLFQAASCNHQIPAKAYEYLRLGRPVFAMTSDHGDTAALLRGNGGSTLADLASLDDLYRTFPRFLTAVRNGTHPLADAERVRRHSREYQAHELAECFRHLLNQEASNIP